VISILDLENRGPLGMRGKNRLIREALIKSDRRGAEVARMVVRYANSFI